MTRPLMQSHIGDLEEMFSAYEGKLDVLRQLEHELRFRQMPRALALLERVQRAMATAGTGKPSSPPSPPAQPVAAVRPTVSVQGAVVPANQMSILVPQAIEAHPEHRPVSMVSAPVPSAPAAQVQPPRAPEAQPAPPPMSVADAYRLLNVAPGSSWETIERARRTAVQKSSPLGKGTPDAQGGAALRAARLANAAYKALAAARIAQMDR
jgi:hypothetical protein